jgi:RNA polymerase sigma-70 factor (ECF subfamily)
MVPEADARGSRAWNARATRATHDADDAELVRAVAARDEQALAAIYHRHADTCYALARRVLNDRTLAEEVVQELFVRLWNEPGRFEPERGTLRSFLLAQVHGRSVDLLRAEVARRGREQRDAYRAATAHDDLERAVLDLTEAEVVRAAVANLSEGEREAIELAYFGGLTYREVAVMLEQPEGTVKSRIRSGLLRLRAALIDVGILE